MLKDATRRKFDVVMAWAIDRLGRSLVDLLHTLQDLTASGVAVYVDQQALDSSTPTGKLMFQMLGAFSEFERSMITVRVRAGLKRAVAEGVKLGRPRADSVKAAEARKALRHGASIRQAAEKSGLSVGTVHALARAD
jgi:DNA invertase Pin-like site-specific DNA recombinase